MEKFSNKFPMNFSANDEQSTMQWYKLLNLKCLDFIFDHAHVKWNKRITKRILKNPPKPNWNKWNCWLNVDFNVNRTNAKWNTGTQNETESKPIALNICMHSYTNGRNERKSACSHSFAKPNNKSKHVFQHFFLQFDASYIYG